MQQSGIFSKEMRAYLFLTSLVVTGIVASLITAAKIIHIGVDVPFAVLIIAVFTYPIIDCICELWGKRAARQTLWLALMTQVLLTMLIQLSIYMPYADFWTLQSAYQAVLSTGLSVVVASLAAFCMSQIVDIVVYQKIKNLTRGKWLWLRSNISVYLGQTMDTFIFVNIVFYDLPQKWMILFGSLALKIFVSFLMTPVVYLIVFTVNRYLDYNTLAFSEGPKHTAALSM